MEAQLASEPTSVPDLQVGLYQIVDGHPRLIGNQCGACGRMHFPRHEWCARCCSPDLTDVLLNQRGRVSAFSWIDRQPADAFIRAPYMQAEVEMPEGVSAFSIVEAEFGGLKIGETVELALRNFDTPDGRRQAFVFRPIQRQGGEQ